MIENKQKLFTDEKGRFRTQSLFHDLTYDPDAVFTFKDQDFTYEGKTYISLKRLYLEEMDPTEYQFATKHLLGWKHWMRLCENKVCRKHIDEWREELEVKLRCEAIKSAVKLANDGQFQAAKWVADRGWATRAAGRPSKAEIERSKRIEERISDEYSGDVVRMFANGER